MNEPDFTSLPLDGERVVPDIAETAELFREHLARYLFATQFCEGKVVLDVACGAGYGADLLDRAGATSVVGIDISPSAVSYARARYGHRGARFLVADCAHLPIETESIDVLTSFETIEHLRDPEDFVAEACRVLSSGAIAIISTPNGKVSKGSNPYHVREFGESEFGAILSQYFPHVQVWRQDFIGAHRITLDGLSASSTARSIRCAAYGIDASVDPPSYLVAVCSLETSPSTINSIILRSADANGRLQHYANLEQAVPHLREHIANLEARYATDLTAWQDHAVKLLEERNGLLEHTVNLEEAVSHLRQVNRDLEERYTTEIRALHSHATTLAADLDNLRARCANLEEIIRQLHEQGPEKAAPLPS